MARTPKSRLDELLVSRGLVDSRAQAKSLVMSGRVFRGTERLDKPGREYPLDTELRVEQAPRYVSRGGEKLRGFLDAFPFDVKGLSILDVGASTGGFTDCLLQEGAADSVCVDVGRGQLHARLRSDPRVTNLEQLNARHLRPGDLPRPHFDVLVMDLSFISLKQVWPAVWGFLKPGGRLIALVKPQFEAGKAEVDKGRGVIRDPAVRQAVIEDLTAFALRELPGANLIGRVESPITGADGNQEYLLGLLRSGT